jgi:crotonobetainyl-CoA:carnitine CoA-transferase CaiB-like acyl-CoA transferase
MGYRALDLAKSQDLDLFLRLVRTAHVVIKSFMPGVLARLGLGYPN